MKINRANAFQRRNYVTFKLTIILFGSVQENNIQMSEKEIEKVWKELKLVRTTTTLYTLQRHAKRIMHT